MNQTYCYLLTKNLVKFDRKNGVFGQALNIEKDLISIDSSFFELGGHSLKATVVTSRIKKEFDVYIPLVEIFKTPTVKTLAQYVRSAGEEIITAGDERLVPLKVRTGNPVNLFLIHDGTGEVEGYVEFCRHITNELNIWGLRIDRFETVAPYNITIRELARTYIAAMKQVQPNGPYYIAGWSLGGTIAFEMAAQLEQANEEIACLTLFDSSPPDKNALETAEEFNLKSELNFIKNYDTGGEVTETFKNLSDIELDQFWLIVKDYLETTNFDVELLKKAIVEQGMLVLPNFDRLGIRESIYYLNVGRTLRSASARYLPNVKLKTNVHYFKASQSQDIEQNQWNKYCRKSITSYTIDGDHFSIFKIPGVLEFTKIFSKILYSSEKACSE